MPICPICNKAIVGAPDLHEAIITKGEARGSDVDINRLENCVLVHPGGRSATCHRDAQTKWGRDKCIIVIARNIGYDNILSWLESIRGEFKTNLVDEKIRLVREACDAT